MGSQYNDMVVEIINKGFLSQFVYAIVSVFPKKKLRDNKGANHYRTISILQSRGCQFFAFLSKPRQYIPVPVATTIASDGEATQALTID